jgi:predicted SnoaL-like aldol condensation-catalyzing enzyme
MTKKEMAIDFLLLCAKGKAIAAFEQYAAANFKHHNPFFKGDSTTLMEAMDANAKTNPSKIFTIHHALEDGDHVATHAHVQQTPDSAGAAVVHLFRFEQQRIAELWDLAQAVPANSINENGLF